MLAQILTNFGEATGLVTNFGKSSITPIRCDNVDLAEVLLDLPAPTACFPLRYLGLPLAVKEVEESALPIP